MFRFLLLLVALMSAVFADNMWDEKYSAPMSEKDMTLGEYL